MTPSFVLLLMYSSIKRWFFLCESMLKRSFIALNVSAKEVLFKSKNW